MDVFNYINKYGVYTFNDVPFNDVDNIVFSALSYIDFDGIVSVNRFNPLTISRVASIYFNSHTKMSNNILAFRQAIKVFNAIKNTNRYGNLYLYNYVYEVCENEQFGALTIEINKNLVYVSFEGTDQMVSGWKEDFMLSYQFPVLSQRKAIDYINKYFWFRHKNIVVGGHSKGGNLAIVAAMYANFLVKDKIIKIYNNDGPGLLKEQINSRYYNDIKSKLVHIVPNYSIVGLLLRHSDNYLVVKSSKKGILAHDLTTWQIRDKELDFGELSHFSSELDIVISDWINKYSKEKRKNFVESLFMIFNKANIDSFVDIMEKKTLIIKLIISTKDIDKDTKYMLKEFVVVIFKTFRDVTKSDLLSFFGRK